MRQASTRTRVRALIQITVLVEVRCLCCELKPCQREITTDKFETEKNIECTAIFSSLTGSVPGKIAKELQKLSVPCCIQTYVSRLTVTRLNL